uniref:Enoyl reductase (ER) domain-containing protein n=1 Tax=Chromera velia CCMP2878 TaxID=1169474 RepID=A0A0G4FDB6_9ALVE|mmetsp:Transcript_52964/g.103599  ORF Transcript_52964/g.103599 Transcript_52964/m.103599 type:complete len:333 (-) Transcript_52964:253-1251(-)|eukprot:Cvel_16347.t1-p1 / transcript=Cvel_16347.t1 / gene=Cvel_16347 / organism=Chromera_velia_CCMP2878 / gene_product=Putative quinone-oxidoreductase homolog,, putative / transcript_product=Putative quinone-oxidoreductase homolog,, putative / location=Cvel_scaffold1255:8619-10405(-) / protein_length=332 / sequence_SO=supercontig / SO=protein_coding / is_pseudo=false
MSTMKAIRFPKFAPDESTLEIAEVPVQAPAAGEVTVKINYAALNPVDNKVLGGHLEGAGWAHPIPFYPGYDFSGTIETVGEGVSGFAKGEKVFAVNWGEGKHDDSSKTIGSAFAEFITLPAKKVSKIPEGLNMKTAAAVPLAGTTAWQALDKGEVKEGSKVLILGAAGAVGMIAVQLAKLRGAKVFTTCSSRTLEFVSSLKAADTIINYTETDWSAEGGEKDFDAVIDTIGEADVFTKAKKVLKSDGAFVTIASFDAGFDPKAHAPLRFASFMCLSNDTKVQDDLAALIVAGKLQVPLNKEMDFSMENVKALYQVQRDGKSVGKNLLVVASE